MKVLLLATHEERFYKCLINQLKNKHIPHKVLAFGEQFVSWKWRLQKYLNEIEQDIKETYILIDAFDTLFLGDLEEIEQKFNALNADIVLSKGAYTTGLNRYIQWRLFPKCHGNYVNSAVMGKGNALVSFLKVALSNDYEKIEDDQVIFAKICKNMNIKIDEACEMFLMMSDYNKKTLMDHFKFEWNGDRVTIQDNIRPCFVSGPGKSDLVKYIGEQQTCYIPKNTVSKYMDVSRWMTYSKIFWPEITVFVISVLVISYLVLRRML